MATFYRIIKAEEATMEDFLSHKARGIPLRKDTSELRRSWEGVSVYDTLDTAREIVRRFPRIGRFIAVLEIAEGDLVRYEQTGDDPNHYDLWGDPRDMLRAVVRVIPA
ncbi:MAG: hypothetical protein ACRDJE_01660 [Dehalococcoidia bacterium]